MTDCDEYMEYQRQKDDYDDRLYDADEWDLETCEKKEHENVLK